jgi:hypothetical protein
VELLFVLGGALAAATFIVAVIEDRTAEASSVVLTVLH